MEITDDIVTSPFRFACGHSAMIKYRRSRIREVGNHAKLYACPKCGSGPRFGSGNPPAR